MVDITFRMFTKVPAVQVYDLETTYLESSSQNGSVLKGFDGFLSTSKAVK